ncbi:two-component system sensor histidine kinase NtrB [Thermodesulfatator indicus]
MVFLEAPSSKIFEYLRLILLFLGSLAALFSFVGFIHLLPSSAVLVFLGFWANTAFFYASARTLSFKKRLWTSLLIDLLLITSLIWVTDGRESPFLFLYPLLIFVAAFHLGRRGADIFTFLALCCFASIFWLIESPPLNPQTILQFFVPLGAMGLSGLLALRYVEELQRTKEKIKETHEALFKAEELHRHILSSLSSGLIVTDLEKRIVTANKAAENIIGQKELIGAKLDEIFPELKFQQENPRSELIFERDGQKIYIGYTFFPLHDEKKEVFGYGLIFQDITPIKESEERLRRAEHLAALGTMASGLAHEIKNPLASICGAVQFLKEEDLIKPEGKRLFDIIFRETQRLDKLVSDFLLFAKPGSGEAKEINLLRLIDEIQEELVLKFGPNIDWELSVPGNVFLKVEPGRFKQVLLNLCANAIEAYNGKKPFVKIACFKKEDKFFIEVADQAGGIPEEVKGRIFEPFFTTKEQGTGLGLAVVFSLVKGLGGQISLYSDSKGTRFLLSFPKELLKDRLI